MRFPGFVGPSYKLRSVNYDCQSSINLYPENDEMGTGKDHEIAALVGTPGLSLLATIGSGPHRGAWLTTNGAYYVVSGNTVYNVTNSWSSTSVGTLQTNSGPVGMGDNGFQLVITDGPNGYYLNLPGGTITQITDPNWLGSINVAVQDGYFIFVAPNSKENYLSDLNAITFTAPANSTKEGYPDNVIGFASSNRYMWFLGDQTTEVWSDTGNNQNPFQYVPGTFMQYGCAATFSVVKMANTLFWLGKDQTGAGMVLMANGFQPQRISTAAIELAIQSYSTISDAIAWSYQENGHQFYWLTFPTGNATWVYDTLTGLWHQRAFLNQGQLQRHRASTYAYAFGTHVVGDYANGNLYKMSSDVYSDNGNAIMRRRRAPHVSGDMKRIFHTDLQLDIESGTGLDGAQQGTNPQVVLRFSDDGGHNWSNEKWASFGAIGATRKRAIWRRLGQSRNRVYEVTITDPVKVVIMGAELNVEVGTS